MNEEIAKIAKDCGLYIAYDNKAVTDKELELFAEEIILNCISQCRGVGNVIDSLYDNEEARRLKAVADSCERMIKLRFGVGE